VIVAEKGKGPAKHWRLVDPNYQPPQLELTAELTAETGTSGYDNGATLTSAENPHLVDVLEDAQDAQLGSGQNLTSGVSRNSLRNQQDAQMPKDAQRRGHLGEGKMPPLKGGASSSARSHRPRDAQPDAWGDRDFTPDDIEAEQDERRGMQEG
jgi:hypothetical protein